MDSADWSTDSRNNQDNSDSFKNFNPIQDLSNRANFTVAAAPHFQASSSLRLTGIDVEYYPDTVLNAGHHQLIGPQGSVSNFPISLPEQGQFWSQNLDRINDMEVEHTFALANELSQPDQNVTLDYTSLESSESQQYLPPPTFIVEPPTQVANSTCTVPSCNGRTFRDNACLKRHKSEVHGSQAFICSIATCKRSKRGFHRRYNLYVHQKRVHKIRTPRTNGFERAQSASTLDDVSEGDDTSNSVELEDGLAEESGVRRDRGFADGKDFRMKLQKLRELRAEIDEDIRSLERTMRIMEE